MPLIRIILFYGHYCVQDNLIEIIKIREILFFCNLKLSFSSYIDVDGLPKAEFMNGTFVPITYKNSASGKEISIYRHRNVHSMLLHGIYLKNQQDAFKCYKF